MSWTRREALLGLGSIPLLGAVWWAGASGTVDKKREREALLEQLDIQPSLPTSVPAIGGEPVRVGIIGFGIRGEQLCRSLGYATDEWLTSMERAAERAKKEGRAFTALEDFRSQESLNVRIVGVCDIFDIQAEKAVRSFSTPEQAVKRYTTYTDMIHSGEVDAVVIATPDHWHAPMSIEALKNNVHVYVEKPMTHTLSETYELRDAALNSKAVFQVGHQHRQTLSFKTAQNIVEKGILGHVSLITTNTNRNDDNGAWNYDIHPDANPETIDWEQFLGSAPRIPFNKNHFFRWRKWWAYGSGLSGDLLTHDYDRLNCVLKMGMPGSVMASGGIYTHRDGRNVPDVLQVNFEYPNFNAGSGQESGHERGMTFTYSASLGNGLSRPTLLMGHDASMELGNRLTIWPDSGSSRFAEQLASGRMAPQTPIYRYDPSETALDGVSSATSQYFADKGLMWTYIDGKRVDSTFLHMREWLSVIRNDGKVSCGIQEGFEEAMSAHMAGLSWKLGKRIEWDPQEEIIVPIEGVDLDAVLLESPPGVGPLAP
jgi:predicted dehydrogenase